MTRDHDLLTWLHMAHAQFADMVRLMDGGDLRIQVRSEEGWIDVTTTKKPDLRELMWRMEGLIESQAKRRG